MQQIFFTTHVYLGANNPDPAVRAFRKAYTAAHPDKEPDAFTALGYDAAHLMMAAIKSAGSTDTEAVRTALAATSGFKGVTGIITYRNGSRIPAKSVTIMKINQGRERFVASILPKEIPAP